MNVNAVCVCGCRLGVDWDENSDIFPLRPSIPLPEPIVLTGSQADATNTDTDENDSDTPEPIRSPIEEENIARRTAQTNSARDFVQNVLLPKKNDLSTKYPFPSEEKLNDGADQWAKYLQKKNRHLQRDNSPQSQSPPQPFPFFNMPQQNPPPFFNGEQQAFPQILNPFPQMNMPAFGPTVGMPPPIGIPTPFTPFSGGMLAASEPLMQQLSSFQQNALPYIQEEASQRLLDATRDFTDPDSWARAAHQWVDLNLHFYRLSLPSWIPAARSSLLNAPADALNQLLPNLAAENDDTPKRRLQDCDCDCGRRSKTLTGIDLFLEDLLRGTGTATGAANNEADATLTAAAAPHSESIFAPPLRVVSPILDLFKYPTSESPLQIFNPGKLLFGQSPSAGDQKIGNLRTERREPPVTTLPAAEPEEKEREIMAAVPQQPSRKMKHSLPQQHPEPQAAQIIQEVEEELEFLPQAFVDEDNSHTIMYDQDPDLDGSYYFP